MITLPIFLRRLKFTSQLELARMINFSIYGFIKSCKDEDFTNEPLDEYSNYDEDNLNEYYIKLAAYTYLFESYIKSRYVNVMPNHVGITASPLEDAVFFFQIGDVPNSDVLFSNTTSRYIDFLSVMLEHFLPKKFPIVRLMPKY